MSTFRRAAGLIAAILLFATGAYLGATGFLVFGIPWMVAAIILGVFWARKMYATRKRAEDPYDLSRLWDYGPPLNEEEPNLDPTDPFEAELLLERDENGTLYCHNCGHAVPDLFAHCPECGQRLR